MRKLLLLSGLLLFSFSAYSQKEIINYQGEILDTITTRSAFADRFVYAGEINLRGMAGTGDELPFWMYSNQRGRVYEGSNVAGWATGKVNYKINDDSFWEAGAGVGFRDDYYDEIYFDEWYVHYENSWIKATLGKKQRVVVYNGLSGSNENILWSINSQPLPGIQIGTSKPVFIPNTGIGFEAGWNEYLLGKDRQYEDAGLHHKSLHLLYRTAGGFQVKAGIQHFAHYGGTVTNGTVNPLTQNYWDAVTFKHPSQHHLSSYEVYLSQSFTDFRLELLYNHIATDLSGRRLSNTPDGRYGIFYESNQKDRLINSVIYELYTTNHQSHTSFFGADNYFNHSAYPWVYEDKVMGAPFFNYDRETNRVVNNKFTTHHIGIGGQYTTPFTSYPYRLLLTYSRNDGIYERRYRPKQNTFYTMFEAKVFQGYADINIQLATEFNNTASPIFGAGVHLSKRF